MFVGKGGYTSEKLDCRRSYGCGWAIGMNGACGWLPVLSPLYDSDLIGVGNSPHAISSCDPASDVPDVQVTEAVDVCVYGENWPLMGDSVGYACHGTGAMSSGFETFVEPVGTQPDVGWFEKVYWLLAGIPLGETAYGKSVSEENQ